MFLFLFLFGLALGAESPSDDHQVILQRGGCPAFWYSFNGRCYRYISTRFTWPDAELYCVSQGANLVSIHSLEEQDFIRSLIHNFDPTQGPHWIGLSDTQKEGGWMWSDGSAVDFVYWHAGEPNNAGGREHCAQTSGRNMTWNDVDCFRTSTSVCESRRVFPCQL